MLRTVLWQRDHAVTGYVELQYDASPWEQIAADYQKSERLLLSPLLSLLAYRLASLSARARPSARAVCAFAVVGSAVAATASAPRTNGFVYRI